jgi:peroxiredoxin
MQESLNRRTVRQCDSAAATLRNNLFLKKTAALLLCCSATLILLCTAVHAQPPSPFAVNKLEGQRAPDFTLKDVDGNAVALSSFKGKVVLLNFWATWCPPCKDEMPSMNKLHHLLKDRGLVILAVSTDRAVVDVRNFLKNHPVDFTVVVDYNLNVSRPAYKVFMVPTTFLIDKRGIIVKKYFGEKDWTEPEIIKEIEALL